MRNDTKLKNWILSIPSRFHSISSETLCSIPIDSVQPNGTIQSGHKVHDVPSSLQRVQSTYEATCWFRRKFSIGRESPCPYVRDVASEASRKTSQLVEQATLPLSPSDLQLLGSLLLAGVAPLSALTMDLGPTTCRPKAWCSTYWVHFPPSKTTRPPLAMGLHIQVIHMITCSADPLR